MGDLRELFLVDPAVHYFSHGSVGGCPRPVFERYHAYQLEFERQGEAFKRTIRARFRASREKLARFVGAEADDLVFFTNVTTALNTVFHSLPLQPGDEVVGTDHEYGAMVHAMTTICAARGATYRKQPVPPSAFASPDRVVDALWEGVTPKTKAILVSHIASPTACVFPVARIAARARERGVLTIVDGAHAPGQIPLDIGSLGVEYYAGSCHKWMCGPKGTGFLHVGRDLQESLSPLVYSWGCIRNPLDDPHFISALEGQGVRDHSAFFAVGDAIDFLEEHDWRRAHERCHEVAGRIRARLLEIDGVEPLTPGHEGAFASMVAFHLPDCDARALHDRLLDEYRVEIPLYTWNGRVTTRASVQMYNTYADVERLTEAFGDLVGSM